VDVLHLRWHGDRAPDGALPVPRRDRRRALSWPGQVRHVLGYARLLNAVMRLRPARVLEIGSATGSLAIALSWFGPEVISTGASPHGVERAVRNNKRLHGRARFRMADPFALAEFADASFDVAVSQGFLDHFQDDEIIALLRQQLRVARHVVFSVPNRARARDDGRLMARYEWDCLLLRGGFEIVESCDYRPLTLRRLLPFGRRETATMYLATVRKAAAATPRRLAILRPAAIEMEDAGAADDVQARAA